MTERFGFMLIVTMQRRAVIPGSSPGDSFKSPARPTFAVTTRLLGVATSFIERQSARTTGQTLTLDMSA
jgi:hypothetical protein